MFGPSNYDDLREEKIPQQSGPAAASLMKGIVYVLLGLVLVYAIGSSLTGGLSTATEESNQFPTPTSDLGKGGQSRGAPSLENLRWIDSEWETFNRCFATVSKTLQLPEDERAVGGFFEGASTIHTWGHRRYEEAISKGKHGLVTAAIHQAPMVNLQVLALVLEEISQRGARAKLEGH